MPKMDEYTYGKDTLKIHFIGHGTLMLDFNNLIIHVDPVGQYTDYSKQPKADIILITHAHSDHLDAAAIEKIKKEGTLIVTTKEVFGKLKQGMVLETGQTKVIGPMTVTAVPAYNTTKGRDSYHPKGRDNGYVLKLGTKTVYIAGDTEDIPEMAGLKNIDIVFLPMNQPYTMLPSQVVNAVKMIKPKIVYPYHFGNTNVKELETLLKDTAVELRIRDLK